MIEIKSTVKLPFIFKDCKSGFLIEEGKVFTDTDGKFRQSLTDFQFENLKNFKVGFVKQQVVVEKVVEPEKEEDKEEDLKVKTNIPKKGKKGKK